PGKVKMEAPAGLIHIEYKEQHGKVTSVKLINVTSYLAATGLKISIPALGELVVDIAYGGNFYAIVDEQENFKGIQHHTAAELIAFSNPLRQRINELHEFVHPENETIKGCSHILWAGEPLEVTSTARNAVFYGNKAIDRSPCGTGTSARMAQWYAKGKLKKGDVFIHESIIGSKFIGTIEEETFINGLPAIKPGVEGWAKIYGTNIISIDEQDDPFAKGFQVI
ncbi:MAG: proline racemase family protein, partial [Ferruginibacter sp.]